MSLHTEGETKGDIESAKHDTKGDTVGSTKGNTEGNKKGDQGRRVKTFESTVAENNCLSIYVNEKRFLKLCCSKPLFL